ncbi:hypothetical protein HYU21_04430 [Candidatus Woesearchaeota archaeon]|nr:hypothetical protein [Candidatus Woesearchaeota archaeon]
MVCNTHQYTLTKMAMSTYQPRSNSGASYALSRPVRFYEGTTNSPNNYTSAKIPQVNYNLSTATGDQSMFQPLFQTALLSSEQAKDQVSTIEQIVQPSNVVISNPPNPTLYTLPVMYVSQPSTLDQSKDNFVNPKFKKDLSQLIQQELAGFEPQVQSESQLNYWT